MIGVIATLRVKSGQSKAFEAVFAQLAAQVRANEDGNLAYQLCRSRSEAYTYKVLEAFTAVLLQLNVRYKTRVAPKLTGIKRDPRAPAVEADSAAAD